VEINQIIFYTGLTSSTLLLGLMTATVYSRKFRFWPPGKRNRKRITYWILSTANMVSLTYMTVKGLQNFSITINSVISITAIIGGILVTLKAIKQLSLKQTSGLDKDFVDEGLYRYSRNPQVLGNLITLLGIVALLRSLRPVLVSSITGLWLIMMVFSEELWLDQEYGDEYREYWRKVPRFL